MHAVRAPRFGLWARLLFVSQVVGCDATTDTIGSNNAAAVASVMPSSMPTTMPTTMPTDMPSAMPTDMPPDMPPPKPTLTALTPRQDIPNPFHDVLGKTDDQINKLVKDAFAQLFHGEDDEVIYFAEGDDAASIRDILHSKEVRSEGMGLGMMIAVELGKQDEFDKLWAFAKREFKNFQAGTGLLSVSGASAGYFNSHCDTSTGTTLTCVDPYGMEHFAMALIFAHDLWADSGRHDYEADALALLDVMKNKEEQNGGIIDGVTNVFDAETRLALDIPELPAAQTRPSVLMPAYYTLWAEATGDKFWLDAAQAARDFFPTVASTKTGLMPLRAYFDGIPVPGSDTANTEADRVFINIVLDEIWSGNNPSGVSACNKVLSFFSDVGIDKYVGTYDLDGKALSTGRESSLVVVNGITASISKNADRKDYIQDVWDQPLVTGTNRYYSGILQLFAFLILSGKMQVL
ncbi:MAG TPA: glycosyl hydrolase family 8 [Polyangiaceae bacterium]|nr:glycosyl hydrolase family 8 [Polyangiaceae bacterium]